MSCRKINEEKRKHKMYADTHRRGRRIGTGSVKLVESRDDSAAASTFTTTGSSAGRNLVND